MCTVTFIARERGYALGMNRDEKLSRPNASPPEVRKLGGRNALFPSEPNGGTWIGVNDAGISFALINWYSVTARVPGETISRGQVVKSALPSNSLDFNEKAIEQMDLSRINPFRLIGLFPADASIIEWRWNLTQLDRVHHPWQANTWISSGFDEAGAQQTRSKIFDECLRERSAGLAKWLQRLHKAHKPKRGPYSTCMHREDAATVSFTQIRVSRTSAAIRYSPGAPCCTPLSRAISLRLRL